VAFGDWVEMADRFPAIAYALNEEELNRFYEYLRKAGMLEKKEEAVAAYRTRRGFSVGEPSRKKVRLTMEGFKRCEELLAKPEQDSKTCFVAMWFGSEMDEIYEKAIMPAIQECGFEAYRVDRVQHNNDIIDEIIAGIKNSRFVIADMTGYRGGVYYEAGFATALDKQVILTCRKDWFDNGRGKYRRVHFDVNHFPFITWKDGELERLKGELINRIGATINGAKWSVRQ
jgi:hypothetical protein